MSDAVRRAVETVLPLFDSRLAGCSVRSYKHAFGDLWSLKIPRLKLLANADDVVLLLWDETPEPMRGDVRIADYLGPIDWAVAMSMDDEAPAVRVIVLDHGAERSGQAGEFLRQMARSGFHPIPWFNLVDLAGPTGIAQLVLHILGHDRSPQSLDGRTRAHLRHFWADALSLNPGDRHAIANLIGPRLLLGRLQSGDGKLEALQALLRSLQVFRPDGNVEFPWFGQSEWKGDVDRFLLVDDFASSGWAEFLERALDASGKVAFQESPESGDEPFVDMLMDRAALSVSRGFAGLRWDKTILFLDLRLFSNIGATAERRFLQRLITLARGNRRIGEDDLVAVERYISVGEAESNDHHVALTIFPRLLASADPFLPIIVFSSTGQRAIVERLGRFPNLILDFEKPRFTGAALGSPIDSERLGFVAAMKRAVALVRARAACRSIVTTTAPVVPRSDWQVLELLVDESGEADSDQRDFVVGGLAIFHSHANGPELLNDCLRRNGIAWGLAHEFEPLHKENELPKGHIRFKHRRSDDEIATLTQLNDCIESVGAFATAVAIQTRAGNAEGQLDRAFLRMLFELIEAVLFVLLPGYGCDKVALALDVATRRLVVPLRWASGQKLTPEEAFFHFGRRPSSTENSLGPADVYTVLLSVMTSREGHAREPDLARARGAGLVDFEDLRAWRRQWETDKASTTGQKYESLFTAPIYPRPYQVHYAADRLVRLALRGDISGVVAEWFERGFLGDRDHIKKCLSASRADAEGNLEDALACLCKLRRDHAAGERASQFGLDRWLAIEASHWVRALDDRQFAGVTERLNWSLG